MSFWWNICSKFCLKLQTSLPQKGLENIANGAIFVKSSGWLLWRVSKLMDIQLSPQFPGSKMFFSCLCKHLPWILFPFLVDIRSFSGYVLGGGNSNIFHFHPDPWGNEWYNLTNYIIILKWVGSSTNQIITSLGDSWHPVTYFTAARSIRRLPKDSDSWRFLGPKADPWEFLAKTNFCVDYKRLGSR